MNVTAEMLSITTMANMHRHLWKRKKVQLIERENVWSPPAEKKRNGCCRCTDLPGHL